MRFSEANMHSYVVEMPLMQLNQLTNVFTISGIQYLNLLRTRYIAVFWTILGDTDQRDIGGGD